MQKIKGFINGKNNISYKICYIFKYIVFRKKEDDWHGST